MLPSKAANYMAHGSERDPVLFSQLPSRKQFVSVVLSSFNNGGFCKHRKVVLATARSTTLSRLISVVVLIGSVEDMARIVASAIIAGVTCVMRWPNTIRNLICETMYAVLSTFPNVAISPTILSERPNQAVVGVVGVDSSNEIIVEKFGTLGWHRCSFIASVLEVVAL